MVQRFRDAFRGLGETYSSEPNFRFHLFAAWAVLSLAVAAGVARLEALYLLGTVAAVILAEVFNTAIERTADLAAEGRSSPLARRAKDAAAGAVLVAVIHAIVAGGWIFLVPAGPLALAHKVQAFAHQRPGPALVLVTGLFVLGVLGLRGHRPDSGDAAGSR